MIILHFTFQHFFIYEDIKLHRRNKGLTVGATLEIKRPLEALRIAIDNIDTKIEVLHLTHHFDRDIQYVSNVYIEEVKQIVSYCGVLQQRATYMSLDMMTPAEEASMIGEIAKRWRSYRNEA